MLKVTPALKAHAVAQKWVKDDKATDDEIRKVTGQKLFAGAIKPSELAKLTTSTKAPDPTPTPTPAPKPKAKTGSGNKAADLAEAVKKAVDAAVSPLKQQLEDQKGTHAAAGLVVPTPAALFGKANLARVKSAADAYENTRKDAIIPQFSRKDGSGGRRPDAGQPATFMGKTLAHPSSLGKAVAAAWVKWSVTHTHGMQNIPANLRLTDHDRDLVTYAMHELAWNGPVKGNMVSGKKLDEFARKGLLDDTISGGIEVTPVVFDEAIILTPVLYGELFPYVNVVNVGRGRRIKSAQMSNPTFTSGTSEGTAITPFNTASFVSGFDTAIHVATGAMEIGLDFEEDSPVDLGSVILEKYGEKGMEWLERVIAVGNGYNEPLGFYNTVGLVSLQSDNGAGGYPTVSDYEGMMFGVAKQWRNEPGAMTAFVGSDTSYRRARAIQVGPADERRVFGMEHAEYTLLGRPYKVQNNIPNNKLAFINLRRYRLYRRLGLTVRVEQAGRALALANTKLLVLRMRFGGQLENANAAAVITDAAS
jgi:HK97 family phage major capsid protein